MGKSPPANDYSLAIAGASSRTFGTLLDEKAREEEVKKNTATGEKILEKRRREYEEQSLHLDALKNQLIVDGSTLEPDEIKRILVMQLVIGIPAIVSGLGIIIDSVSCQEIRKSKRTGKTGATASQRAASCATSPPWSLSYTESRTRPETSLTTRRAFSTSFERTPTTVSGTSLTRSQRWLEWCIS